MPDYSAGSAYLDITPTLSGDSASLQRQIDTKLAGVRGKLPIELDEGDLQAEIDDVQRRLDELGAKRQGILVTIQTGFAQGQLDALNERLDVLTARRVLVEVNADTAKTQTAIDKLNLELDELSRKDATPRVTADTADAKAKLDDLTAHMDYLSTKKAELKVELKGAPEAAAGLAAVDEEEKQVNDHSAETATSLLLLGSSLATTGIYAGGAGPALGLVGSVVAAFPGLLFGAAAAGGALMLGMNGIKQAAQQLTPEVNALKASLSATFNAGLTPVFDQLRAVFPVLSTGLNSIAQAEVGVAREQVNVLTSGQGLAQLGTIFAGTRTLIDNLSPGLALFTQNMLTMASTGMTELTRIGTVFTNAGSQFQGMLTVMTQSGVFQSSIHGLVDVLAALFDMLNKVIAVGIRLGAELNEPLAGATRSIGDMVVALEPLLSMLGGAFLSMVTNIANVISQLAPAVDPVVKELLALGDAITAVVLPPFLWLVQNVLPPLSVGLKVLMPVLGPLTGGVILAAAAWWLLNVAMDANPFGLVIIGVTALIFIVGEIVSHWGPIAGFFEDLWGRIRAAFLGTIDNIVSAWNTVYAFFANLFAKIGAFFATWGPVILAVLVPFIGIPLVIYQHFDQIVAWLAGIWASVQNTIVTVWNAIGAFFNTIWNYIRGIVTTVLNAIVAYIAAVFTAHLALWIQIWTAISNFFTTIWDFIRNTAITVWTAISSFLTGALNAFAAFFESVWNREVAFWTTIWNFIRTIATEVWNAVAAFLTSAINGFVAYFESLWNREVAFWTTIWNFIRTIAVDAWNAVVAFLTPAINAFSAFFQVVWNAIATFFSTVWNGIRNEATTIWGAISSFFTGAFNAFSSFFGGVWNGIATTFTTIWQGISTTATNIWNGIIGVVKGAVDGVIDAANWMVGGVNKVLSFLLIPTIPAIPRLETGGVVGMASGGTLEPLTQHINQIPMAAAGTSIGPGFVTRGPKVIVGEGRASHPEYVIPTDPAHRTRATSLYKSLGSHLAENGAIVGLAGGGVIGDIGGAVGTAAGWTGDAAKWVGHGVSSAASAVGGALSDAAQWASGAITGMIGNIGSAIASMIPAGLFQQIGPWIAQNVIPAVEKKIQAAQAAAAAAGGSAGPGSAVNLPGNVTDWAVAALALTGRPGDLAGILQQIQSESGGNPNAVNHTDINAQEGHPSQGILQMIPSTFAAYMLPGHGNILNPIDNIASADRYGVARYGGGFWAPGGRHSSGYDDGGYLPVGMSVAFNGTGKPEPVFTSSQFNDMRSTGAGQGSVQISGAVSFDPNNGLIQFTDARISSGLDAVTQAVNSGPRI